MSQADDDLEVARQALEAFEDKRIRVNDELKQEGTEVNARYQAAEAAVLAEQPPAEAPTQTVGG